MIIPKKLKKNDTVALIAPSSAVPPEKLHSAIKSIEKLGFNVVVGESCKSVHGYFAGTDEVRANDINQMFADETIDGIFCIRGGYGSMRLLTLLNYDVIKNNPKVFAGYSDVTALHIAFNQHCQLVTYHAPMASTELNKNIDMTTRIRFIEHVTENEIGKIINNPPGLPFKSIVEGSATGQLVGGNLSLIAATLGTPYEIDTKGKILFLEDVDEYTYRIDRLLTQLRLAGKFDEANGIVLGGFTNCKSHHEENSLTLEEIFQEILVPIGKPILANVACGHCLPTITLPLGVTTTFNTKTNEWKIVQ